MLVTVTCSSNNPVCGLKTGAPEMPNMNCAGITAVWTCDAGDVPLLLVRFRSSVLDNAEAMFVNTPTLGAVTVMVKFVEPPLVKAGIVGQVMTLFENEPPADVLLKARLAGRLSCTTMLEAVEGPPLVTTMV